MEYPQFRIRTLLIVVVMAAIFMALFRISIPLGVFALRPGHNGFGP